MSALAAGRGRRARRRERPDPRGARLRRPAPARAEPAAAGAARAAARAAGRARRRRAAPASCPRRRGSARASWRVAPAPADLQDRRCEITGPVERKMMINALNSGARVFMADYEDANSPTWTNVVEGQRNVSDAIRRTIALDTPEKSYRLNEQTATLLIRPRGWHLPERHVTCRRRAGVGLALRLRRRTWPATRASSSTRQRAVLLPAEARVAPRGAAVGAGVRARRGGARRCRPARSAAPC